MGASKQEFIQQRELENTMNVTMGVSYYHSLPTEIKREMLTNKKQTKMINLEEIKQQLINEEIDPLEVFANLKEYEKGFKEVLNLAKEQAIEEAEKYEKTFELKGFKFERQQGRAIYNFKGLKEWQEAEAVKKQVEAKAKNAFNAYKLGNDVISEDGELQQLPEVSYTSDVLKVKKIN